MNFPTYLCRLNAWSLVALLLLLLLQLSVMMLSWSSRRCSPHRCRDTYSPYRVVARSFLLRMLRGAMLLPVTSVVVAADRRHGGEAWRWTGRRPGGRGAWRRRRADRSAGDDRRHGLAVPRIRRHGVLPSPSDQPAASMVSRHDHVAVSFTAFSFSDNRGGARGRPPLFVRGPSRHPGQNAWNLENVQESEVTYVGYQVSKSVHLLTLWSTDRVLRRIFASTLNGGSALGLHWGFGPRLLDKPLSKILNPPLFSDVGEEHWRSHGCGALWQLMNNRRRTFCTTSRPTVYTMHSVN